MENEDPRDRLIAQALIEHGKRLGELAARLDLLEGSILRMIAILSRALPGFINDKE
jgi:hypothetical protein